MLFVSQRIRWYVTGMSIYFLLITDSTMTRLYSPAIIRSLINSILMKFRMHIYGGQLMINHSGGSISIVKINTVTVKRYSMLEMSLLSNYQNKGYNNTIISK